MIWLSNIPQRNYIVESFLSYLENKSPYYRELALCESAMLQPTRLIFTLCKLTSFESVSDVFSVPVRHRTTKNSEKRTTVSQSGTRRTHRIEESHPRGGKKRAGCLSFPSFAILRESREWSLPKFKVLAKRGFATQSTTGQSRFRAGPTDCLPR